MKMFRLSYIKTTKKGNKRDQRERMSKIKEVVIKKEKKNLKEK